MRRAGWLIESTIRLNASVSYRTRWVSSVGPVSGAWLLRTTAGFALPDASSWQLFAKGPHSRLFRSSSTNTVLAKFVRPRSHPRDDMRKYGNAQARREFISAYRLQSAGLLTPTVHGWGLSLSPFAYYESVLFMEEVPDYRSSLSFIRECDDHSARAFFLERLAADMARLHGHALIHKDGHFDNIGWVKQQSLVWIDNDIRHAKRPRSLVRGFRHMHRMLRRTARDAIRDMEWRHFNDCLRAELARWPQARILIDEV